MAVPALLNADMATVGGWIRQGWRWWLAELAAMVPARFRTSTTPSLMLVHEAGGATWSAVRRGASVALDGLSRRERSACVLALRAGDVLERTVTLPALAAGELRQMIALDLDRLMPFPPGAACFDHEVVGRGEAGTALVQVVALPLARARALLDSAEALDVTPARLAVLDDDGRPRFDLLPALGPGHADGRLRRRWWMAVALLFLANAGALIGRDIALTEATRAAVEERSPAGRTAATLRQRIDAEARRRVEFAAHRDRTEPLRVIAILSSALPPAAWVERMSWDGEVLRIAGLYSGDEDLVEVLGRSPLLRDVRQNDENSAPAAAGRGQPFDISANILPTGAP